MLALPLLFVPIIHPNTRAKPTPIDTQHLEGPVYAAGVPSHKLFGGMAYFIKGDGEKKGRRGNLLIDTPDAEPALVEAIKEMGGLDYIGACGVCLDSLNSWMDGS